VYVCVREKVRDRNEVKEKGKEKKGGGGKKNLKNACRALVSFFSPVPPSCLRFLSEGGHRPKTAAKRGAPQANIQHSSHVRKLLSFSRTHTNTHMLSHSKKCTHTLSLAFIHTPSHKFSHILFSSLFSFFGLRLSFCLSLSLYNYLKKRV